MIKKYTFLFLLLTFLFTGTNILFATPVSKDVYPGIAYMDNVFQESAFENSGIINFSDDLLEEQTVWTANGSIYVRAKKDAEVNIYTITGQLSKQVKVTEGETAIPMSRGLYIVRFDNVTRKVIVK